MNTALWVAQALVAAAFLGTGSLKAFRYDVVLKSMQFAKILPKTFVILIGVLEILGAIGVIVPSVTGIVPKLSVLACCGLIVLVTGAIGTHVRLKELGKLPPPIVLALLCAFVAYGREFLVPL